MRREGMPQRAKAFFGFLLDLWVFLAILMIS